MHNSLTFIRRELNQSNLIIFIGSDLERSVTGLPSRVDLAYLLAQHINLVDIPSHGQLEPKNLAEYATFSEQEFKRRAFTEVIYDSLFKGTFNQKPTFFYRAIVELFKRYSLKTLITSAYDNFLEIAFQEEQIELNILVRSTDANFIHQDIPTLIKLFGDIRQVETLAVTIPDQLNLASNSDKQALLNLVRNIR